MVTEYDDDASRRTLANQLALWVDEQAGAYPECISLVVQAGSVAVEATIVLPRATPNAAAMVRNCTSVGASCDGTLANLSVSLGVQVLSVQSSRRIVAFNAPSPPPPMLPLPPYQPPPRPPPSPLPPPPALPRCPPSSRLNICGQIRREPPRITIGWQITCMFPALMTLRNSRSSSCKSCRAPPESMDR